MTAKTSTYTAATLLDRADKLQARIDSKLNPAIAEQRPTARRAKIAASMREEGYRLQRAQTVLRGLARLWNEDPGLLAAARCTKVKTVPAILDILNPYTRVVDSRVVRAGITTKDQLDTARTFLQAIIDGAGIGPTEAERDLERRERDLIGRKIPGFFPTPPDVIEGLLDFVEDDIGTPASVLEPSAGKGDIAGAVLRRWGTTSVTCVEVNHDLAEILRLKGFQTEEADFLSLEPSATFDAVIMNPPFENFQDILHVHRALEWVRPGGVLVAIVSEGPFFRETAEAVAWRLFLEREGAENVKLEPGAFKKAFRSTGVNARVVTIRKN